MRVQGHESTQHGMSASTTRYARALATAITMTFLLLAAGQARAAGYCSQTADSLFVACRSGVNDDSFVKRAVCMNLSDIEERMACREEQLANDSEGRQLCLEQRDWRRDACKVLGEGRYDPRIDPSDFNGGFTHLTNPNPFFPLTIGHEWTYEGGGEVNTVRVTDHTKLIEGVTNIVVRDEVFVNGEITEGTNDWFAQALDGTVWYFGEETAEYESFEGDHPRTPELIDIEGSFKAGRDGSKPGIIFLASPHRGDAYLEEFSLGNAEDVTQVLSTGYSYGRDAELDRLVPRQLADRFCNGDCVVTKNFSLLEPGVFSRKYYARGIGVFVEVEEDTVSQLVGCNFDSRCSGLLHP